ncbi:MAG TPA: hypothetical protein VGF49_06120 [Candidatus Solibacter sp.]
MEDSAGVASGPEPIVDGNWLISEIPGKPVTVRLSLDLVMRLGMAVREGFKALPRRGLETGGLLVGATRKDRGRLVIDVRDFEPVESEHATGPSYMLSDLDRQLLESRIAARQAGKKGNAVIGFYRSHTRRNFAVTMEDAALFSTYFRKPLDLFLLIKSNEEGPPTCGLLLRESGKELSGSPCVQFPFDGYIFPMPTRELHEAIPEPQPEIPAVVPAPPPTTRRGDPARWSSLLAHWQAWVAIAAGLILAIAIPVGTRPAYPHRSLALNVVDTGGNLKLSWDHQASPRAARAVLFIRDGAEEHHFELDSRQLSEGSISYWPATHDVNFRLEWTSPSGKLTESVRAIGASAPAPVLPVATPPVATAPAPVLPVATPPVATAPAVPAVASPPAPAPAIEKRRHTGRGTASRQQSRAFTAPDAAPAPAPAARAALPEPPMVIQPAVPSAHGKDLLQAIVATPGAALATVADAAYRVDVQPVPRRGRSIPLIGKRSLRTEYVPPVPLHKSVLPNVPRRDIARDIDVKVYVNPAGKVDYAELLSRVSKADVDLASMLVFSARRWEFVPARDGADPAPGEVILHYRFGSANP